MGSHIKHSPHTFARRGDHVPRSHRSTPHGHIAGSCRHLRSCLLCSANHQAHSAAALHPPATHPPTHPPTHPGTYIPLQPPTHPSLRPWAPPFTIHRVKFTLPVALPVAQEPLLPSVQLTPRHSHLRRLPGCPTPCSFNRGGMSTLALCRQPWGYRTPHPPCPHSQPLPQ